MDDTLFLILKVLTLVTAVGLILSPIPIYIRIVKTKTTGDFSIFPAATIFFSCYVWVVYGCLVGNFVPLVATDSCGSTCALLFMIIYYRYTPHRKFVLKLWAIAGAAAIAVTIYVVVALKTTNQSHDDIAFVLGFIAAGMDLCMYASPLATIRLVVKTKDASSMPLLMSVVALVNSVLWVVVSTDDLFLAIPNGIAAGFSVIGIVLYFIYRPGKYSALEGGLSPSASAKSSSKDGFGELQSPVVIVATS